MTDISPLAPSLPRDRDGFRVEIDAVRQRTRLMTAAAPDFWTAG